MNAMQQLLTKHMAIWTAADTEKRSGRGRASGNAGSVYGIKKLRELILELAVRGKLVPQDANDEPASELLKRIQAEKAKLIAEGKLKKEKPLAPITQDEKPFELPHGWEYVKLGDVAYSQAGFAFKSNGFNESGLGLPLIRIRDVGQAFTGTYYDGEYRDEFVVVKGDYLISMDGEFRVAKWLNENSLLNQRVSRLIFLGEEIPKRFIAEALQAELKSLQGIKAYTTVDHLSGGQISNSILGLPPLTEQHRIVAKVDELMTLCDHLEAQHSNASEAHEKLVSHLLGTLTQSQSADDFSDNWQRIAAHFDTLFTTEASIDALKQALLQLAVMGKLVPQNADDEPASELLKRIQAEKSKLVAEGKIKKDKPLAAIADDEKLFKLPQGWMFVRLREIATHLGDGLHGTPIYTTNGEYYFVNGNNLKDGKIIIKHETKTVDVSEYEKHKKPLNASSVLVSINGTLGSVGFYDREPIILGKSACYINLVQEKVSKYFVKILIDAPSFMEYALKNAAGTTIKNLGLKAINDLPIALPPCSEQQRIVAKVDALMALCDQLKSRINQASKHQQLIANALVAQALA